MADNLGSATLELGVDNTGLQSGMQQAQSTVGVSTIAMGALFAQLAQQILTELVGAIKSFVDAITTAADAYGTFIDKLEAQTGIGAASIQKMAEAFQLGGISEDQSSMMIKRFQDFVAKVQDGDKTYTASMTKMGLSTQQFMALSEEDKLNAVMTALGKMSDKNQEAAVSTQMFGRSSQDMALIIKDWPGLVDKANSAKFLTQPQLDALKQAGIDSKQLSDDWSLLGDKLGAQLEPNFDALTKALISLVQTISDWLTKNPKLLDDLGNIVNFLTQCIQLADMFTGTLGELFTAFENAPPFLQNIISMLSPSTMLLQAVTQTGSTPLIPSTAQLAPGVATKAAKGMASGGIVTSPQLAMIGESGPEAVIPLNQMNSMNSRSLSVNVGNFMGDDMSLRQFARTLDGVLKEETQRSIMPRVQSTYYSVGGHL